MIFANTKTHKMLSLNNHTKMYSTPKPTWKFKNCSHVCVSLCTTVIHNTVQNSSNYFPPNLQTIITAQRLSIGGKKDKVCITNSWLCKNNMWIEYNWQPTFALTWAWRQHDSSDHQTMQRQAAAPGHQRDQTHRAVHGSTQSAVLYSSIH